MSINHLISSLRESHVHILHRSIPRSEVPVADDIMDIDEQQADRFDAPLDPDDQQSQPVDYPMDDADGKQPERGSEAINWHERYQSYSIDAKISIAEQ